jgi:glycosyltransferase involved in cell wall biosynthesis
MKRACMLAYSFYETDNRVRRYAECLVKHGYDVDAVSLRRKGQPKRELLKGVNVFRIQGRERNERWKITYLLRLLRFFFASSFFLTVRHLRRRYDLIHVHSIPDFEVFAALFARMTGARVILDIHDIVPEFYASKFHIKSSALVFKGLVAVERASTAFADHVIIANHLWEGTLTERSVRREKCTTFLNYPDRSLFSARATVRDHRHPIVLYPGTVNRHQGVDVAVRAFASVRQEFPTAEFHIYGDGPMVPAVRSLVEELGLEDAVLFKKTLPLEEIAAVMANATVGVVPKRNDAFGGDAFSTKILEFMVLGVPVCVAATRIDRHYFHDDLVRFFEPENSEACARSIRELLRDDELRQRQAAKASAFIEDLTWDKKEGDYMMLVERLIDRKEVARPVPSEGDNGRAARYVVITPARDEGPHIEATIQSVLSQTVRPAQWVLVDDGSTDDTGEIIDRYARGHPWIIAIHRKNRGVRKSGGGVVETFSDGLAALTVDDWDYIVKLDADLSFSSDYFERAFARFAADPQLGIGGGCIYHIRDGIPVLERTPAFHVRGATKIYRRACWTGLGGLIPAPGWDTLDEVKANMLGWKTASFPDLMLTHHKFTGSADGSWGGWVKNGRGSYIAGYHPLYMLSKSLLRTFRKPYVIGGAGLLYGYVSGYVKGIPRVDDAELIAYLRRQQLNRLLLKESIWK